MKMAVREFLNVWIGLPVLCVSGSFAATVIIGTVLKRIGLI
jgi:hypothetical protein